MHFRKYKMIQKGNQKKYGEIKATNFTIGQWNNGLKKCHKNVCNT